MHPAIRRRFAPRGQPPAEIICGHPTAGGVFGFPAGDSPACGRIGAEAGATGAALSPLGKNRSTTSLIISAVSVTFLFSFSQVGLTFCIRCERTPVRHTQIKMAEEMAYPNGMTRSVEMDQRY